MIKRAIVITLLLLLCAVATSAQTLDEIIAKHLDARGGAEKLKSLNSIKMTAHLFQSGQQLPVVLQKKRPENVRMELSFNGTMVVQAYDGAHGWAVVPFSGSTDPIEMSNTDAQQMRTQADFDGLLVNYKTKGDTVELIGKETVDGSGTYKLKVTRKNGDIAYVYLLEENFLEFKTSETIKQGAQNIEIDTYQSSYRNIDGLNLPHVIEGRIKGQLAYRVEIEKIELNLPLEDNIFHMPMAKDNQENKDSKDSKELEKQ